MMLLAWVFQILVYQPMVLRLQEVPYSEFLRKLESGEIEEVVLSESRLLYTCCGDDEANPRRHNVVRVDDPDLIERLTEAGVKFSAEASARAGLAIGLDYHASAIGFDLVFPVPPHAARRRKRHVHRKKQGARDCRRTYWGQV